MIAKQEEIPVVICLSRVFMVLAWKGMLIGFFPEPFDLLLWVCNLWDIVDTMADLNGFIHNLVIRFF